MIFSSNRSGHWDIFKQLLGEDTAESVVTRSEGVVGTRKSAHVTPDGRWVLYAVSTKPGDESASIQVMRVPINGGPSEPVLTARFLGWPICARLPANLCLIVEIHDDHKQLTLTAFDPLGGRGGELARIDLEPNQYFSLDLSPDGTRIAYALGHEGPLHVVSLHGAAPLEIKVKGWSNLDDLDWAADSKALFVSAHVHRGSVLLRADLQGNTNVLWQQLQGGPGTYSRISPDGRHLALLGWRVDDNIWMMENF